MGLPAERISPLDWSDVVPQDPQLAKGLSDMGQVVQQLQELESDLLRARGKIRTETERCVGQAGAVGCIVNECV